jgi:hypothetical protein
MRFLVASALALATCFAAAPPAASADLARLSTAQWRHDLEVLATELPRIHPHPFHAVAEADWRAATASLAAEIPRLKPNQVAVGLMRLVAMIGEGHTTLNPLYRPELGFHYLPIRPYLFSDGLYVRAADRAHAALVGAKIVQVGTLPAEQAFRALSAIVAHDNDSGASSAVPLFLAIPEVLNGAGIAPEDGAVVFGFEKDGRRFTETLTPAGVLRPGGHGALGSAFPTADWFDAREGRNPIPLWLQDPASLYWSRYLPESKLYYIQVNAVASKDDDPIESFASRVLAEAEKSPAEKLVLDVRSNGGGNSFFNRPLVKAIIRSRFDQPGRFFVIIGRGTFSAAQNLVNDLAHWTSPILVGEPTASNPNQYGDHELLRLPESGLVVMVSTLYHQTAGPQDHRQSTAPQLPAGLSFAQYRDGVDPAMDAVSRYRSIAEALAPALGRGDASELARAYRHFKTDPATDWIPTEAEVNSLGYRLLAAGEPRRAIEVFRLNLESYPRSANVWDSLGEAYLKAGDRAHAMESYRRSLELNPKNDGARRVLDELGGKAP